MIEPNEFPIFDPRFYYRGHVRSATVGMGVDDILYVELHPSTFASNLFWFSLMAESRVIWINRVMSQEEVEKIIRAIGIVTENWEGEQELAHKLCPYSPETAGEMMGHPCRFEQKSVVHRSVPTISEASKPAMSAPTTNNSGAVYFLQAEHGGPVKIGTTSGKVNKRMKEIQGMSPVPLRVIGVIPGCTRDELKLHRRFSHLRLRGEWFKPEPELLEFITSAQQSPSVDEIDPAFADA